MARSHARVQAGIWNDSEWRALGRDAQWTYVLLLSQPDINNVGVLALVPRRWASYANETNLVDLEAALHELENAGFVLCDEETQELVIRTFVKHDRIEQQPHLVTAAKRQFGEVRSPRIQDLLRRENPHLFGVLEPLLEPLSEGGNAHAREWTPGEGVGVGHGHGEGAGGGARAECMKCGDEFVPTGDDHLLVCPSCVAGRKSGS